MYNENDNDEIDYKFIVHSKGPLSQTKLEKIGYLIERIGEYHEKIEEDEEKILRILLRESK
jgi:hypothetical protein